MSKLLSRKVIKEGFKHRVLDQPKSTFIIRKAAIDTCDRWTRTFAEAKRNVAVHDALFVTPTVQP